MTTRSLTLIALLLALALCLHQVERLFPLALIPYPGVKLGLGNLVTLVSLFVLSRSQALLFVFLRSLLTAVLGSFSGFLFSLTGAMLAFALMCSLSYAWPAQFSLPGLSIAGAVAHNFGQLLVAAFLTGGFAIVLYLPVLLFSAVISGLVIGIIAAQLLKALHKSQKVVLNPRLLPLIEHIKP